MPRSNPFNIHSTTAARWEELPPELVHDIFHHAARLSTKSALTLCKVSSWTRCLALPYLYSTVILKNEDSTYHYTECLKKPPFKLPEYELEPKTALRSLWPCREIETVLCVISIVKQCDNLVHLALYGAYFFHLLQGSCEAVSRDAFMRKGNLHLIIIDHNWPNTYCGVDMYQNSPILSRITHLQLTYVKDYQEELDMTHFKRLTHLCVPFWSSTHDLPVLNRILNEDPCSIEVLVVAVYVDLVKDDDLLRVKNWFREKRRTDRRVYTVAWKSTAIQKGWEKEVRGGESIWSRALRSARKHQNGK